VTKDDIERDEGVCGVGETIYWTGAIAPAKRLMCPCGGRVAYMREKKAPGYPCGMCTACEKVYMMTELEALP
jgi:hypothetical protein